MTEQRPDNAGYLYIKGTEYYFSRGAHKDEKVSDNEDYVKFLMGSSVIPKNTKDKLSLVFNIESR